MSLWTAIFGEPWKPVYSIKKVIIKTFKDKTVNVNVVVTIEKSGDRYRAYVVGLDYPKKELDVQYVLHSVMDKDEREKFMKSV